MTEHSKASRGTPAIQAWINGWMITCSCTGQSYPWYYVYNQDAFTKEQAIETFMERHWCHD